MWGELAHSLQQGNSYIVTILIMAFIAVVVFFERLVMLQFVYNIDFPKFLGNLKKMVAAEDLSRAINLCKNVSSTSLPRIGMRALEAAETDPTTVRGTIEEEAMSFLPALEKRLSIIPAVSLLIMLVGILGTIDALWHAFQSIDVLDTARKQATLAQGIASSLNPTALGLSFALILLAGHYLLRGIATGLCERMHYGVTVLTNLLCPQEVAAYMPVDSGGSMPSNHFDKPAHESTDIEPKAASEAQSESFEDVSVEDIKDEEEII